MKIKHVMVSTAVAAVLAGGVMVGAQDDTPTPPENPPTTSQMGPRFGGFRDGGFRDRMRQQGVNINHAEVLQLAETYTGLTQDELREALTADEETTLGSLIEANGESVEDFVAEAAVPVMERIDEAVADGVLTEERASEMQERVTARLTDLVETASLGRFRDGRLGAGLARFDGELIETYTGLTPLEAAEQLRDGATMAELIEANGESVDDFIAEAVIELEAAIDERVEARKATLEDDVTAIVNGERPIMPPIRQGGPRGR